MSEKRSLYGRKAFVLLAFLFCLCFTGCGGSSSVEPPDGAAETGVYRVYACNPEKTALVYRSYKSNTTEAAVLVNELWRELRSVPDAFEQSSAVPDSISVSQTRLEGSILYLYFDESYQTMSPTREVLCRAAIVRTMTQLPEVTAVSFFLGEEPMKNRSGVSLGLMQGSDFIDHVSSEDEVKTLQAVLYFASQDGRFLVRENRSVPVSAATSQEKALVAQLIAGPAEPGHQATLPANLEVLSLLTKDGVCYVSFDRSFTDNSLDLLPEVVVYSLVNSLTELPAVNQVQISVDGNTSIVFKDTVSLENPIGRNLLLVKD